MTTSLPKVLPSWRTGKDGAWALRILRQQPDIEIVGLFTTFNETLDRVAMHFVRRELEELARLDAAFPPAAATGERYRSSPAARAATIVRDSIIPLDTQFIET